MKIIVASTITPFVEGGSTLIVEWLAEVLSARGHNVEVFRIPFSSQLPEMLDQMLALRLMDLSRCGDRLIAIRTPSYLLRHPNKVCWFIHHHRAAYDLWKTIYGNIPTTPEGLRYRDAIRCADNAALGEARHVFANSRVVAERLKKYNGIDAGVLYPPLHHPDRFRAGSYGDYLLYLSRWTHHKRQWLAVEALRFTRTPIRLVIAGSPDPGAEDYVEDLQVLVQKHQLSHRVTLVPRWISEEEKINLLSECLASVYFPFDEDSYGYPSLESYHAGKAVISTSDAGGTGELVIDGETGFLTAPQPEAIAGAMDRLYLDRGLAQRMGEAGRRRIGDLDISWDKVLDGLLA